MSATDTPNGRSSLYLGVALVLALLAVIVAFRFREGRISWSTRMPDGSKVSAQISGGVEHVFWRSSWHALAQALPGLSASIRSDTKPMGCNSTSPSIAIYCSFQEAIPNASRPEFVLTCDDGREITLQRYGLFDNLTPGGLGECQGIYAMAKIVPKERRLRLRVYHKTEVSDRALVAEWKFRNPLHGP